MENPFYIDSKFEIKKNGKSFLNDRRIELLKAIKRKGSTRSASSEIKMSYQQAWHFIKDMNETSPLPLVINQRGGTNGGGTEITKFGEKTICEFEKLRKKQKENNIELSRQIGFCFLKPVKQNNE